MASCSLPFLRLNNKVKALYALCPLAAKIDAAARLSLLSPPSTDLETLAIRKTVLLQ